MYRTIQDFLTDWKVETEETLKLFTDLTDASLSQRVTKDGRSLGRLTWHIILTFGEMGSKAGLKIDAPEESAPVPAHALIVVAAFERAAQSITLAVEKSWNDAALLEEVEMYGEKWTRGFILSSLIRHQAHHRGQVTVLMRQAGLRVHGVYGPAREEWSALGMSPME